MLRSESSNPALSGRFLDGVGSRSYSANETMTINGTAFKTMIAIALAMTSGVWTYVQVVAPGANPAGVMPFMWGGLIVGTVLAFATMFKPNWAPITTPVYSIAEGFFLGTLTGIISMRFPPVNIAGQAVALTGGVLLVMLVAYQTGLIRVTERFRMMVTAATGAVFLLYMASFILRFFDVKIPYIHGNGMIGIGFSLFVVGLAAFNLALDFDMIDRMVGHGSPKHMEWYGAFALMTTLVWLYLEVLKLLAKLQSRND